MNIIMAKVSIFFVFLAMFFPLLAQELKINWAGSKGEAIMPPAISSGPGFKEMKSVIATVTQNGGWQGIAGAFSTPIDLKQYGGMEFYIKQSFYSGNPACVIRLNLQKDDNFLYRDFSCGNGEWTKVVIPFDRYNWTSGNKTRVEFSEIKSVMIYPYKELNRKDQRIEICGLKFIPHNNIDGKIVIQGYKYINPPQAGDAAGKILNDGDTMGNAVWLAYKSDPEFIFDLGGIYMVKDIKAEAFSAPSHNFSTLSIQSSNDNKNYLPVGIISNEQTGSEKKNLTFMFSNANVAGRYFKFTAVRPRSDFPIELSEISFTGHAASQEEMAANTVARYYIGPEIPKLNKKDYYLLEKDDLKLWINHKNGVIGGIIYKGMCIAERLYNTYQTQTREKTNTFNSYTDMVTSTAAGGDKITLKYSNPALPGVKLEKEYCIENGSILEKITIADFGVKEKQFLCIGSTVVLNQQFRQNGVYETWGADHIFSRMFAADVLLDIPVSSVPTISFENHKAALTLFHYRNQFNGRFIYLDPASDEERTTIFQANGWTLGDMTVTIGNNRTQSCGVCLDVVNGSLINAYDRYLQKPEVSAYLGRIKRPAWLRDVVAVAEGSTYRAIAKRIMTNFATAFRSGYIVSPANMDLGFEWGELPVSGKVMDIFGGEQSAEELKIKIAEIKKITPRIKFGLYTWLWSAFPYINVVKQHPEWFVKTLRNGDQAWWFPGLNRNWMRLWDSPESRDEAFDSIIRMIDYYNLDIWYLDGGNAGSCAKDWDTMRVEGQENLTELYWRIRDRIQKRNPDSVVFFNAPCNPQGDFGYLESFDGAMTSEWRKGAAWMWKFKLFQYKDPSHYPVYIYWLSGIDGAYQNYMVGTGLLPDYSSREFSLKDVPFAKARYEVRQIGLVDGKVSPDWRHDPETTLECMTLKQGETGFVYINSHSNKIVSKKISVDLDSIGITDHAKPVYQWIYTVKSGKAWGGIFGEEDVAKAYQNNGLIADRALIPAFVGTAPWNKIAEREFKMIPEQCQMWVFSQTGGFIWSIDGMPCHYRIPSIPGIELRGGFPEFTLDSEYDSSEIAMLLPESKIPGKITIDGKVVSFRLIRDAGAVFAIVPVKGKGKHQINGTLIVSTIPQGNPAITLNLKGCDLEAQITGVENWKEIPLLLSMSDGNNLVWSYSGKVTGNDSACIRLGNAIRDGEYEVIAADISGKRIARRKISISGLAKPTPLLQIMPLLPEKIEVKQVNRIVNNIAVLAQAIDLNDPQGKASVNVDTLTMNVASAPMLANPWNSSISSGLELKLKRFVKLRIDSGFKFFNIHGAMNKVHFIKYDNPNCFAGMFFDFETKNGKMVRSAVGMGKISDKRTDTTPRFGANCTPDLHYMLNELINDEKADSSTCWLDLTSLGAPADWNGKTWVSISMQLVAPNRKLGVSILETRDQVPEGAIAVNPVSMSMTVVQRNFSASKISEPEAKPSTNP